MTFFFCLVSSWFLRFRRWISVRGPNQEELLPVVVTDRNPKKERKEAEH